MNFSEMMVNQHRFDVHRLCDNRIYPIERHVKWLEIKMEMACENVRYGTSRNGLAKKKKKRDVH